MILFLIPNAFGESQIIYSVDQDIPMGYDNEIVKKNYYVNIGENLGVKSGTVLDVFRILSRVNPYQNSKRVNYKIKIGELEVLHTEEEASVAKYSKFYNNAKSPFVEIDDFMIGDHVSISVKDK